MLVITAQEVLFTDQKQQAAVFSVVSGIILTFVVVTPAFLVLRGIAPAVTYFKIVIGLLLLLIVGFGLGAFIKNGSVNIFSSIGLVAVVVSYWLVRSDAYQLLHIFTVRRRLMAEQDLERKKQLHSN